MSPTKRRAEQRQGQRRLNKTYAQGRKAPFSEWPLERLAEHRNRVLDAAEELLDAITAQVQKYRPTPGERPVALAKTIACIAEKVVEVDALLHTLAEVEELASLRD